MKLLLDTHILLWSLIDPGYLSKRVAYELENPANELWLSPITVWEILVLCEKGRISLDADPSAWLRGVFERIPFREAMIITKLRSKAGTWIFIIRTLPIGSWLRRRWFMD